MFQCIFPLFHLHLFREAMVDKRKKVPPGFSQMNFLVPRQSLSAHLKCALLSVLKQPQSWSVFPWLFFFLLLLFGWPKNIVLLINLPSCNARRKQVQGGFPAGMVCMLNQSWTNVNHSGLNQFRFLTPCGAAWPKPIWLVLLIRTCPLLIVYILDWLRIGSAFVHIRTYSFMQISVYLNLSWINNACWVYYFKKKCWLGTIKEVKPKSNMHIATFENETFNLIYGSIIWVLDLPFKRCPLLAELKLKMSQNGQFIIIIYIISAMPPEVTFQMSTHINGQLLKTTFRCLKDGLIMK